MFEWDENKNRRNIEKHGVSFELASRIFENRVVTYFDTRFDYGELREVSIGTVDGILILAVVHTDRDGNIRLISARPAKRKEKEIYDQAIR